MILADADIFIEALKNSSRAIDSLRNIGFENIKDFRFIEGLRLCELNRNNDFLSPSSPGATLKQSL
jgi:hypothetical protein